MKRDEIFQYVNYFTILEKKFQESACLFGRNKKIKPLSVKRTGILNYI